MKTTRGIIPTIWGISDDEIADVIRSYRDAVAKGYITPDDLVGKSDADLRPYAVNTILYNRSGGGWAEIKSTPVWASHNID